jgi:flagellar motility protein MotE (MotC chaperone)
MIGFLRDLRLVPIVLLASACLLSLKLVGLLLDGGYILSADDVPKDDIGTPVLHLAPDGPAASSKQSWAQQMFNFPDATGSVPNPSDTRRLVELRPVDRFNPDITGSVPAKPADKDAKPADKDEKPVAEASNSAPGEPDPKNPKDAKAAKPGPGTQIDPEHPSSGAERLLLERLQERRHELDSRARELDIRESLIKAAEKRLEARLVELKDVEGRISAGTQKKEEAEAAHLKGLVTMYENMKPRDAAKIFDRLDMKILYDVATQINPRRMSDILAQMSADSAERLTVEIANRARDAGKPAELPKIEGRPTNP